MSCICQQPVRPGFKESYKDLLDKPKINGVPLDGDVDTDNLHINYPHLANLPRINGVTLDGDLTAADLGVKAGAQFKIVQQLPVTDIDESTIYLVPVQVSQTDNIYQEWLYINNKWEKIGEPISIQGGDPVYKTVRQTFDVNDPSSALNTNFELPDIPSAFVNYIISLPSTVFDNSTNKNFYINNLARFIAEKSKVVEMNISFLLNNIYNVSSFEFRVVAASYVGQENPFELIKFTESDFVGTGPGFLASAHLTIADVYGGAIPSNNLPGINEPEFISVIQSRPQIKPSYFYPE